MEKKPGDFFFSTKSADIAVHRKTDAEILASEEKYRAFFATSIDCVFITTLDGRWVDFNEAAIGLFGYDSREELMRIKIADLYADPADRDDHIRNINQKGYSFEYPVNLRKKDGTVISTLITTVARKDSEGNIIGFQGTIRDITEKKAAEDRISELLRIQDEQLRIINTSPAVTFLWRAEENWPVKMVSDNITKFGYSVDDFISGRVAYSSIIHPDDLAMVATEVEYNSLHNIDEFSQVYRIFGKDKKEYWIDDFTHIRRDSMGRITHYEGIILDITERKRAEEALKVSENRYRTLFEDSPISLWEEDFSNLKKWIDAKRQEGVDDLTAYFSEHQKELPQCVRMVRVIHINRATMALFGASSLQEFKKGLSTIFSKESLDAFREEIVALCNGKTEFEKEIPLRTLRGDRKMIIMKVTVVPGYEQTFARIFVSGIDITDRKNVEKALHQANKKLNMLSSITRHDILNLIMAIRGYLELSEELVDNPELKEYMKRENAAVDSIQRQIEFTRYYQDIGVEEPKWQDAGEIVRNVVHQLNLSGIAVENNLPGLEIFADPLIGKVFYNLVENSLRHGEHVTTIRFLYTETGPGLTISYRDNGVGITEADKKKLFQKGFGKHTGLGLFLSREILSITGITIQENGEPGNGVNFEISVPEDGYRIRDTA